MYIHEFSMWRTVPDGKFIVIVEKQVELSTLDSLSTFLFYPSPDSIIYQIGGGIRLRTSQ